MLIYCKQKINKQKLRLFENVLPDKLDSGKYKSLIRKNTNSFSFKTN